MNVCGYSHIWKHVQRDLSHSHFSVCVCLYVRVCICAMSEGVYIRRVVLSSLLSDNQTQ